MPSAYAWSEMRQRQKTSPKRCFSRCFARWIPSVVNLLLATWLYRVAVNIVLASRRRKSLITNSLEEVTELKEGISSLHQVLGAPDRVLTTAIDRLNLECAFSQMPAGYRQVFLMHDVEGYEHHEIARILGLSIGTSKSQLHKARVWLRATAPCGRIQTTAKKS